jgi:hypothetical protein
MVSAGVLADLRANHARIEFFRLHRLHEGLEAWAPC